MKIAIVVTPCLPVNPEGYGGIEKVAGMLADEIAKRHDVTVYGAKGSKAERAKVVETVEPQFAGAIGEILQLEQIIDELKEYDIVNFHYHSSPPFGIWEVHDLLPPFPVKHLKIIARSIFHAKYLEKVWGWEVDYCYNPIDIREWDYSYEKDNFILFFSRICRGKGAITFAKWCKELKIRGIIAGTDDIYKGANPDELMEFYKSLSSYTEFMGEVTHKEIAKIMPYAKALVLPYDPRYFIPVFDLVIVEALACGTPVLTIKTGATVELLGNGKTRIGYTADSIEELKTAVKKINKLKFDYIACRRRAMDFDVRRIAKVWEKEHLICDK
ncbi:MAG: hypothetical protein DRP08_02630 [Candidatus Aenigmatarchaeota archaeon]|nr:MAG: hypothetical protein DRP08_02630 [Candidatus Aenigmarchaeota archaeon]